MDVMKTMVNITPEMIAEASSRVKALPHIHPEDFIYQFLVRHPKFQSDMNRVTYYFNDGQNSANKFFDLVARHGSWERPSVLEFASGYGCVTRHLVKNDKIDLFSSDIHPQAMEFLSTKLGAKTILSASIPEKFTSPQRFDVTFALSFFSHMPITTWSRWLVKLTQVTKPGGLIIFTTQGEMSARFVGCQAIPELGFWFRRQSEQDDLSVDEYGQTVVTQDFVSKAVKTIAGVKLLEVQLGNWWNHQDVYILRKLED
jgi:SAM-dependent methyltransferase